LTTNLAVPRLSPQRLWGQGQGSLFETLSESFVLVPPCRTRWLGGDSRSVLLFNCQ